MAKTLLFVCTANLERSVVGEYIAKKIFADKGWNIISAGVQGFDGEPAGDSAVAYLKSLNIDCSKHVAKSITDEMLQRADLILCMTESQEEYIKFRLKEGGWNTSKVDLLSKAAGDPKGRDVDDLGQKVLPSVKNLLLQAKDRIIEWMDK